MRSPKRSIEIKNLEEAKAELKAIGVDPAGIRIMVQKAVHRAIKIKGIRPIPANIIKQEMLSRGGEVAVSYGALNQSVSKTDILIFGTEKQIIELSEKLGEHQFGLPELGRQIKALLDCFEENPRPIKVGRLKMDFGRRTYIMGILNVTPDSFSDAGKFMSFDEAVSHAKRMAEDGADIIDIGGESTRPGSKAVSSSEEKKRVIPIIKKLSKDKDIVISIDTTKADVAEEALSAGAHMVNDISGLHFDKKIAKVVAKIGVPIVLMHIKGIPRTMQGNPVYNDLVGEILDYLEDGIKVAESSGINREKIIIDPGIGFGKTADHNLDIIRKLGEFRSLGRPVLIGTSRKAVIGKVLDLPSEERLEGTAATVAASICNGADIVRVHDVPEMVRVVKMTDAIVRRR